MTGKKAKAEPGVKKEVKKEPKVKVKREIGDPEEKKGFSRGPLLHYRHQVGFVDRVVPGPWKTCFSTFGTGFVGVVPTDSDGMVVPPSSDGMAVDADRSAEQDAAAPSEIPAKCEDVAAPSIPSNATIVIFIRAPASQMLQRNGKSMGGYSDTLDTETNSLEWSGQRGDVFNKKITTIMNHCRNGGRVVVGVRPPSALEGDFRILGELRSMENLQSARFLVNPGDTVLREQGTRKFHKNITVACLNENLRQGVGIAMARHPAQTSKAMWCKSCCYMAPRAVLHFEKLHDEGVATYRCPGTSAGGATVRRRRAAKVEKVEMKTELDYGTDGKRFRAKMPPIVKTEPRDEDMGAWDDFRGLAPTVKAEPVEEEEEQEAVQVKAEPEAPEEEEEEPEELPEEPGDEPLGVAA